MKNYILTIDAGNTNVVFGLFWDGELKHSWRFATNRNKTEDEYFALLSSLFRENDVDPSQLTAVGLGSVVPQLNSTFEHLTKKYLPCPFFEINATAPTGLTFPVQDYDFIGADLIINAYAAAEKYKTNCLVCDFGTATTIQLVGQDKYFYGTVIIPGVMTAAGSLFEKASLLSRIKLSAPQERIGTSTAEALKLGIIDGSALMIDGFIERLKQDFSTLCPLTTIATGGIAPLICSRTKSIDVIDAQLTLYGIDKLTMLLLEKHAEK